MHDVTTLDFARIAQDLQIRKVQVESVVQLLDEGNTVPFITRYRKERTGGLNEEVIRTVQARVGQLRHLAERKQTILKSIEGQGKLTDELRAAVVAAETPKLQTHKSEKLGPEDGLDFKDYFQFTETVRHIPPHRILAINRGEKENVLGVKLESDTEGIKRAALDKLPLADHPHADFLRTV